MVTRGHYETFLTLRNKAINYRSFSRYDSSQDEERVTLVTREENGSVEMSSMDPPYWIAYVEQFRFEAEKINRQVDQLEEVQKNILKMKNKEIFAEDSSTKKDNEMDQMCLEISKRFNRLHSLVNQIKNIPKDGSMKERVISNILQWEYHIINRLSYRFRDVQRTCLNKLREYDDYMIKLDDTGDPFGISPNHNDINLLDNFDLPSTEFPAQSSMQKVQFLQTDNKFLQMREQEVTNIMKSMEELNQVFNSINTAVINQGSLLDRIDYNIENVEMSVEQGVIELSKAERSVRRSRKMKCVIIITLSIFFLLILTILRS